MKTVSLCATRRSRLSRSGRVLLPGNYFQRQRH